MPRLHVGWAYLIARASIRLPTTRWRYLVIAQSIIVLAVAIVTGNHDGTDGFLAIALVTTGWRLFDGTPTAARRSASRLDQPTTSTTPPLDRWDSRCSHDTNT